MLPRSSGQPKLTMSVADIQECKALASPPKQVVLVSNYLVDLLWGRISQDHSWKAMQAAMNNPRAFVANLQAVNLDRIDNDLAQAIVDFSVTPDCDPQNVTKKSSAMGGAANYLREVAAYFCSDIEFPEPVREETPSPERRARKSYMEHTNNSRRRVK